MSAAAAWAASALAGATLGLLFFGGLWLTVRRVPEARRPGLLMAGSFLVRVGLLAAGLLLLARAGAAHLLAGLLGVLVARTLLVRRLGRLHHPDDPSPGEAAPWS